MRRCHFLYRFIELNGEDDVSPSWQRGPVLPGGQMQRKALISSTQVAPEEQGDDWHSLTSERDERRDVTHESLRLV